MFTDDTNIFPHRTNKFLHDINNTTHITNLFTHNTNKFPHGMNNINHSTSKITHDTRKQIVGYIYCFQQSIYDSSFFMKIHSAVKVLNEVID